MARPYDRAATVAALVNALVVLLLPLGLMGTVALVAPSFSNSGTHVVGLILEGAACGFAGALLVLLPGILTKPTQAPPYVIAYGGLAAVLGLAVGVILWVTGTVALRLYRRQH